MTNPPLERAARAAFETYAPTDEVLRDLYPTWEEFNDEGGTDNLWFDIARAVLMAVREPTPKMINATWNHPVDRDGGIESQNTRNERIYKAMIDAILGEGEGE